jgi:hypothetical protein
MEVHIPIQTYQKIMHWINLTDKEVGGFGKVVWDAENKSFTIIDAYLLKQEVGSAHTDIDADSMCDLMVDTFKVEGELKWWWHSHVNMDVFWSSTDRETIQEIGEKGWCLATVFNKKYQMRSALGFNNDVFTTYSFADDIKTVVDNPSITSELQEQWTKEYKDNVREKSAYIPQHAPLFGGTRKGVMNNWDDQGHWSEDVPYMGTHREDYSRGTYLSTGDGKLIRADQAFNDPAYDPMDANEYGFLGYGLRAEAAALGMTPMGLAMVLDEELQDTSRFKKVVEKLNRLDKQGKFTQEYVDRFEPKGSVQ